MMCAGVTICSPLKIRRAGPGKKVGAIGVGGLGHLGIQWAVAFGAVVTALSSSDKKEKESKEWLGAHHNLNYSNPEAHDDQLGHAIESRRHRRQICLGRRSQNSLSLSVSIVLRQITFAGSIIGSPAQIEEMIAFAVEKGVNTIVEVMPMSEAAAALHKVDNGQARFRIVLKN
ncbi:hypothetical protein AC1031_016255 [Aphanomyces cochlioides]|nr:hypothetical protein AC1031_016255 [Aphanomyces cochlioides]